MHLYTFMIFLIMSCYYDKAVFNWSKRGASEATQKALRYDLKTVPTVKINEGLLYKQLLATPSCTQYHQPKTVQTIYLKEESQYKQLLPTLGCT